MLNDNFYRGSGITIALQRLLRTPAFQDLEIHLAGCETIDGEKSLQENTSMVAPERYKHFALMEGGPGLIPALYRFASWTRTMRFDVLHVHHRRLAVLAHLTRLLHRTPVLFTGHLTFPDAAWFKAFAPRTATGVSPSVVEYLRRSTKAVDVRLIYNPVNFPAQEVIPLPFSPPRVISVGRLEPIKGYETLMEAWSRLKAKGIEAKLDIFGEGSLRSSLETRIASLDLQDNVSLCGFVSDISETLSKYAFNVLVSQKEGFPNVVVEAAAYGLPTLLTDVEGSRDALPAQLSLPNGLPYGDVDALSNALATWLGAPQLLREDGRSFHRNLKARCSPDIVGAQYLELYASMARQQARRCREG